MVLLEFLKNGIVKLALQNFWFNTVLSSPYSEVEIETAVAEIVEMYIGRRAFQNSGICFSHFNQQFLDLCRNVDQQKSETIRIRKVRVVNTVSPGLKSLKFQNGFSQVK
jgi:hypothetical protein